MKSLTVDEIATLDLLAYLYLKYGQAHRACIYLKFLIHVCPESARIHRSYATALLMNNAIEEALQFASISLELAKSPLDRAVSQLILCFIFHKLNRSLEAKSSSTEFILERQRSMPSI